MVRHAGLTAVVRPLVSRPVWQATFHAVAGLLLGATAGAAIYAAGLFWWAAVISLANGSTGHWILTVVYAIATIAGPLVLPRLVWFLSTLQRERFRALLEVEIAVPAVRPARGWRRIVRPLADGSTWRQLGYHLLAPVLCSVGGALVVFTWSALALAVLSRENSSGLARVLWLGSGAVLTLAAPWVARGVARVDTAVARRLLGPGRAEQLQERVQVLARSRADLVAAADAERRRIERDLHDGLQQRLVSLALNLGMARESFTHLPPQAREVVAGAHDEATAALAELREFVRGLHPAVLNDRGLDAALSGIVARAAVPVELRVDVATRCSASIEAIAYFTVSEVLTNVARHANATRAEVTVQRTGDGLLITVTDDGRGGASVDGAGSGLRGLAQRAASVDGTLSVVSPPGGPTTVTVYLPCE
jgi:signal transduction histidine kinase